jgi:hypothetical protein
MHYATYVLDKSALYGNAPLVANARRKMYVYSSSI